jgi:hypothetical protein
MSSACPVNLVPNTAATDRVLIHVRFDVLGPDRVLVVLQRHDPGL